MILGLIVISGCLFNVKNRVKDLVFSPAAGTYSNSVQVTLSSQTTNAEIHYTLDGSTPDESDTLYTKPISLTSTTTVKAIGYLGTFLPSNVATVSYTINTVLPTAVEPTVTPATGTYMSAQQVTMSSSTPGAQIRYTINGAEPTASSTLYNASFQVFQTTTINAKTFATGYTASATTTRVLTINLPPAEPVVRSFSSSTVSPGGTVTVTLTKTVPAGSQSLILEENQPAGFTFSNPSCGSISAGVLRIFNLINFPNQGDPGPTNGICTYTATAPISQGTYTFVGKYILNGGAETNIGGTTTITVGSNPN
jgi:hypothetical protein